MAGNLPSYPRELEIVQTADESSFDALGEEFRESIHEGGLSNRVGFRYYTGKP